MVEEKTRFRGPVAMAMPARPARIIYIILQEGPTIELYPYNPYR